MSRISGTFRLLHEQGRTALVPYVTAGDPSLEVSLRLLHRLGAAGANIIELGVPFSDPMADGPVIQRASERALARGVGLTQVLQWVREFRQTNATTPVVLMGYANPIERFDLKGGEGAFVAAAAAVAAAAVAATGAAAEAAAEAATGAAATGAAGLAGVVATVEVLAAGTAAGPPVPSSFRLR